MLLAELVETSRVVAATASRLAKVAALAGCLRRAAPGEVTIVVSYLSGETRQRRLGVGWAALRELPAPAGEASLAVMEVDRVFAGLEQASGSGSIAARRADVAGLFGRATADEQRFLARLISGELHQGALAGIMADAVAKAAGIELATIRRAAMLSGDLAITAEAALSGGLAALEGFRLRVGTPVQPMLAQPATSVQEALERARPAVVEWKLDGIRVQVHREGSDVAVFTRTLDDITARLPELVEAALGLPVQSIVLDGEAIALRPDGRPRPFQETGSRTASSVGVETLRAKAPLTPYFFDVLHLDGADLIDEAGSDRFAAVSAVVPAEVWVPRLVTDDGERAAEFFAEAVGRGHEGVVVKALGSRYEAGRLGAGWFKVKPRHTLDLVVLAVEWGHGRRQGWLSNLHLGARDPVSGGFVMLGKTFKGLTDEMLRRQTVRFQELQESTNGWTVYVRPEVVAEVAFDGIQTSPRYPGGMALRFARVLRYRPDKRADEADTIETVRMLHEARL